MSEPRYQLARCVPAPPDAVLAAIRDAIASTQRSDLPAPLRTGVRGLWGRVRGQRFTVGLDHTQGGQTDLAGSVGATDDGGSEVRASAADDRNASTAALVTFGIAGILAWTGNGAAAWMAAGFGAIGAIVTAVRRGARIINHDEAAFLLAWLQEVLDTLAAPHTDAGGADPAPPASPA